MIIAIVSDAIYPYHKGGKEKRIYELSTRLAKMGHEVHVYTMKWWDGPKNRLEDGVNLHAISRLYPLYVGERRSIKSGILFGVACLRLISQKFDAADVDHMPYFPLYSMWAVCKLKRRPMFGTWHEVWGKEYWLEYLGFSGYVASWVERMSIHLPKKIVSISVHTSSRLSDVLKYKKEVEVLSPGIDIKAIKKVKTSADLNDVVYAGRLIKHKNIDMLIRAISSLKDDGQKVRCLIIGEGPEKKRLIKLANKLKVEDLVGFHDFYDSQDELYSNFKTSKVFALPSSREGFGIVVIEANACGIPVVTNSVPDNAAKDLVISDYNGYHFDNTVESLASALKEILLNERKLEKKCLSFAESFDWDKLARHSLEIYSQ
jgi:glycosyltransferase involved in cell wall biosynthesis